MRSRRIDLSGSYGIRYPTGLATGRTRNGLRMANLVRNHAKQFDTPVAQPTRTFVEIHTEISSVQMYVQLRANLAQKQPQRDGRALQQTRRHLGQIHGRRHYGFFRRHGILGHGARRLQ